MTRDSRTIVLIHGQWLTPRCWELFCRRYEEQGSRVLAPAWPRLRGAVEEIRRDPAPLGGLGLAEIVDHYERIVASLGEPPILIGHSLGGLVAQILLNRQRVAAAVAIAPAPPQGIFWLPLSSIRAASSVLSRPWNYWGTASLSFAQFRHAFANGVEEDQAHSAYERYAIPGPARTVFQVALANGNPWTASRVDFQNNDRAPLLLIAGGDDRLVPPTLVRRSFKKYAYSMAVTQYREFPGHSHLIVAEPGWQEVADFALAWAQRQMRSSAARNWHLSCASRSDS